MKIVMVEEKKHIGKVLLRHFQNQQHNTKFFIQTLLLCFFIWGSISIAVSAETDKTGPSNPSSSNKQKSKSLISKFYELAKDKDAGVRTELAETVGKTGKLEALKLLEEMATDKDLDVRRAVVKALGQTGRPEALKLLEKIIKNELKQAKRSRYFLVENAAIPSIVKIHQETTTFLTHLGNEKEQKENQKNRRYYGKSYTGIYQQIIQYAKNKGRAEKQAIDLADQTKKKILQLLNTLAKDKDFNVREQVVKETPVIDNLDAFNLLEKLIKDKDARIRKTIVTALEEINNIGHSVSSRYSKINKISEKINTTKTMYILEKLAKDQDKDVRISAIKAMGELNKN